MHNKEGNQTLNDIMWVVYHFGVHFKYMNRVIMSFVVVFIKIKSCMGCMACCKIKPSS